MAWDLPSSSANNYGDTTNTLPSVATQLGSLDDLQPGDMIDGISFGHVVLFKGWTDSSHTTAEILEEPHSGATAREDDSYYTRSYLTANGFTPYRYNNIMADPTPDSAPTQDINGDGHDDLVAVNAATGHLQAFYGNGTAGYTLGPDFGAGWGAYSDITDAGDLNGDGRPDLVAVNNATGHLQAFYGNGTGGYTLGPDFGAGWGAYSDITNAGDLNGDGRPDLVAVNNATGHLQAFYSNGTAGYTLGPDFGAGWGAYSSITNAGDLNGDGHDDLVAVNTATGHLQAFYGNGTAGYSFGPDFGAGWGAYSNLTDAGDINGDGHDDLVAVNTATGHLQAFYGNGTAGYTVGPDFGAGWSAYNNLT
ncbi:VCBS repeat-containing protein [Streptacidiphilus sp. 4-A2]|nr:VCBS repeat-containing protein [Streptacidiphilus sp. 4-A2]